MWREILELYQFATALKALTPFVMIAVTLLVRFNAKSDSVSQSTLTSIGLLVGMGMVINLQPPPANLFEDSNSSLYTSGELLAYKLGDPALEQVFESRNARNSYALFGPAVQECEWCDGSRASYMVYNAPTALSYYLANVMVILLATVKFPQWRFTGVLVSSVMMAFDLQYIFSYELESGRDWVYWDVLQYRKLGLLALNFVLSVLIFVQSTGRLQDKDKMMRDSFGFEAASMNDKLTRMVQQLTAVDKLSDAGIYDKEIRDHVQQFHESRRKELDQTMGDIQQVYRDQQFQVDTSQVSKEHERLFDTVTETETNIQEPAQQETQ